MLQSGLTCKEGKRVVYEVGGICYYPSKVRFVVILASFILSFLSSFVETYLRLSVKPKSNIISPLSSLLLISHHSLLALFFCLTFSHHNQSDLQKWKQTAMEKME